MRYFLWKFTFIFSELFFSVYLCNALHRSHNSPLLFCIHYDCFETYFNCIYFVWFENVSFWKFSTFWFKRPNYVMFSIVILFEFSIVIPRAYKFIIIINSNGFYVFYVCYKYIIINIDCTVRAQSLVSGCWRSNLLNRTFKCFMVLTMAAVLARVLLVDAVIVVVAITAVLVSAWPANDNDKHFCLVQSCTRHQYARSVNWQLFNFAFQKVIIIMYVCEWLEHLTR